MATEVFEIPETLISFTHDNLYTTTAAQFQQIYAAYKRTDLPNDILFPWLHGVDGLSNQQNLFFGVRRCMPPRYRGILIIHCNPMETSSRLIESVLPSQVLFDGHFSTHRDTSINLRNFQNQIARFASICDIICYGQDALPIARLIASAQSRNYAERQVQMDDVSRTAGKRAIVNANDIIYKTIVIEDDFSAFEEEFVMFDGSGIAVRRQDFWELEQMEMREMSKASEITSHVWIGNTQDAPVSFDSDDPNDNPHGISICIEAHDLADMPLPSTLMLARETLNDPKNKQTEVIHFDMYATGVPQAKAEFDLFCTRLLCLLKFMQEQSNQARDILIHCSDGYTETSLLGLSWIMYHLRISLPEAYLYFQKKRSFFVYASDIPTLRRIEQLLFGQECIEPEPKRKKSEQYEFIQTLSIGDHHGLDSSDSSDSELDHRVLYNDDYLNKVSNLGQSGVYKQLCLSPTKQELELHPWFYSTRFEGSFPSRVLPFLYLGNLNHATNPDMLKALHITHIVSVGEKADLNPLDFDLLFLDNLYDDGIDSIRGRLDQVLQFIDDARLKGTICLVHCRVGVSRSAAITIAYAMNYLKLTLVQAYLYVRARRLNVIIQPNLKFMYELLQLEQKQHGNVSVTWPTLCQEIYKLNSSYRDTSMY